MATAQGSILIQIEGLDELRKKLHGERADKPVSRFLDRGASKIQGAARKKAPVDIGRLRNSIGIEVSGPRERKIGPSAEHGEWVEMGTRPHWPPPGALAGWAKRHGMDEFAIRRKIGLYGTKPQPYLQPAAEESESDIAALVSVLASELESAFQ